MPVIFNQLNYAEELLNSKERGNIYSKDLNILTKYFFYKGKTPREISESILEYCKRKDPYFSEIKNRDKIHKAFLHAKKYDIRTPIPIGVTKSELEKIRSIGNLKYELILFSMLVCAKYFKFNITAKRNLRNRPVLVGTYCNVSFRDILALCDIKMNKKEQNIVKHDLFKMGMISPTFASNKSYKINFIDDKSDILLIVSDYREIVAYYYDYIGKPMETCPNCGRKFIKNRFGICKQCNEIKKKELNRERVRSFRERQKLKITPDGYANCNEIKV